MDVITKLALPSTRLIGLCVAVLAAIALSACGQAPEATSEQAEAARATAASTTANPGSSDRSPDDGSPGADARQLNIYNWADYIAEDTIRNFEVETGIRVNYNVYSSNQTLQQSLGETPDAYDLVFPSARPYAQQMVTEGRLHPLDKTRLSNHRNLNKDILRDLSEIDPENAHVVPYMWGTTGLGINVREVTEALGRGARLDSWNLLFDPATTAKLSSCGIGIIDDSLEAIAAAQIWRGRDVNNHSQAEIDAVKRAFMAIRPHVRKITGSSELIRDLAAGDLCVALTFSGDVLQARAKAAETPDGPEIRYVIPREGAVRWTDVVAIPKNAKHHQNAHMFIDYLMRPKVIAEITNFVAYANANVEATALIDQNIAADPGIYPPQNTLAKLRTIRQLSAEETERQKTLWIKVIYGEI
jgi:putrescine transport system substrate-binding protein